MAAPNPFSHKFDGLESPSVGAFAVTPSDTVDLPSAVRAVTILTSGVLSYEWKGVVYTTGVLPVGTYPMRADRIRSTGTTAGGITGWV